MEGGTNRVERLSISSTQFKNVLSPNRDRNISWFPTFWPCSIREILLCNLRNPFMKLKGSLMKNIAHGGNLKPYSDIIEVSESIRIYLKLNKGIHDVFVISEFVNRELKVGDGKCKINC